MLSGIEIFNFFVSDHLKGRFGHDFISPFLKYPLDFEIYTK